MSKECFIGIGKRPTAVGSYDVHMELLVLLLKIVCNMMANIDSFFSSLNSGYDSALLYCTMYLGPENTTVNNWGIFQLLLSGYGTESIVLDVT